MVVGFSVDLEMIPFGGVARSWVVAADDSECEGGPAPLLDSDDVDVDGVTVKRRLREAHAFQYLGCLSLIRVLVLLYI
jgi:hypothetical protein